MVVYCMARGEYAEFRAAYRVSTGNDVLRGFREGWIKVHRLNGSLWRGGVHSERSYLFLSMNVVANPGWFHATFSDCREALERCLSVLARRRVSSVLETMVFFSTLPELDRATQYLTLACCEYADTRIRQVCSRSVTEFLLKEGLPERWQQLQSLLREYVPV